MKIITTVVGSYPTDDFKPVHFNEKLYDSLGLYDKFIPSVDQSVESFIKYDVDIICDGQVRGDMVKIFMSKINGIKIIDNTTHIVGKITPASHPITIKDLHHAFRMAKSKDSKFKLNASLEEIFNHEAKGIKGILTGPTTLIHSSLIDNFYSCRKNAIYDMAKALTVEAKAIEKAGACAIQIDEPFISTQQEDINVSKKAVEMISESVDIPVILHVCGSLENVMEDLLQFNVDMLDFEFSGMSQNIDVLRKYWTSNINKLIGIGCINTRMDSVDDIDVVRKTIQDVVNITKQENIVIDPDCGMRMLPKDVAMGKLGVIKDIKNNGV